MPEPNPVGLVHTAGVDFIYLKLPAEPALLARLEALHAGLDETLQASGLGSLMGWGRSLGGPPPQPSAWHRIDIEARDAPRALALLREALSTSGVPAGSELHYSEGGQALQQDWDGQAWGAARPSTGHRPARRRPPG